MELNEIYNEDCVAFMEGRLEEESVNILYTDVPYLMGSRYTIDDEGHYCFKGKGSDFMSQWEVFDGRWWHRFFKAAYRVIKPGGFFITHQIDRQADLHSYYARRSGFMPIQKLYWMYIDSFPKGVDVALKIDDMLGVERKKVGVRKGAQSESTGRYGKWGKNSLMGGIKDRAKDQSMTHHNFLKGKMSVFEETKATSEMAKKYDGYKYGQAPLKQVLEEILVFWKEPVNTTVPKEIAVFEDRLKANRPTRIHPSVFNIKDTRVQARRGITERWTPQLLVDTRMIPAMVKKFGHAESDKLSDVVVTIPTFDDNWNYVKKATTEEKEWGLDDFEPKRVAIKNSGGGMGAKDPKWKPVLKKNTHPSPKPLALCKWVLNLFKIPNYEEMVVYDPFAGQGSIPLAAKQLGMKWIATELSEEFFKLAKAKLTAKEELKLL